MKLEIIRGKEYSLVVEDVVDSITQSGFLADSYLKAFDALAGYIKNSDKVRENLLRDVLNLTRTEILYRSPKNIIAFSGKRGSGKTSTMLSFSDALKDSKRREKLNDITGKTVDKFFVVLDPVDPTTLEENQSILSVFLSKLLFKAEKYWKEPKSFYGDIHNLESKKIELLGCARKCLNGISAIRGRKGIPEDLSDLQRVGDSSILKKNLYEFVELFMDFYSGSDHALKDMMLVFQIDDTDCQICRGYEVMEDIRKYLTIPNVLILMATDTELLRQVLVRHYISDFSNNVEKKLIDVQELRNLGEKYMVKLLPPTNVIYLPNIDDFIRDKMNRIHLYYKEGTENLLCDLCIERKCIKSECKDSKHEEYEKYDFQSVVLRYIYRKTHIVFASHDAYSNNIIPTTLRGLAYLLNLLSSMEDVPEINFSARNSGESEKEYLVERLKLQFPILEKNLNLFEDFFLNDWVQAKLPQELIEIIEQLSNQVPDQRIPFIIRELKKYYYPTSKDVYVSHPNADLTKSLNCLERKIPMYQDLDEAIRIIQGTLKDSNPADAFRLESDFYFIFAIRTFLTIENNKDVLKVKRRAVDSCEKEGGRLEFNYLKIKTSLPNGFYMEPLGNLFGYPLIKENVESIGSSFESSAIKNIVKDCKSSIYFQTRTEKEGEEKVSFNLWGGIIEWLAPKRNTCNHLRLSQIYEAQELAVLMAANCDVQEVARKAVAKQIKEGGGTEKKDLKMAIERGLELIQDAIADINQGMLSSYKGEQREGEGKKLFWRIGTSDADALKRYGGVLKQAMDHDRLSGKKEKSVVEEASKKSLMELPMWNLDGPVSKDSDDSFKTKRMEIYNNLQEKKENGLTLSEEAERLLRQLMDYNPRYGKEGNWTNKTDYEKRKKEWNDLVEKLQKDFKS